jgi:hypothetical protein
MAPVSGAAGAGRSAAQPPAGSSPAEEETAAEVPEAADAPAADVPEPAQDRPVARPGLSRTTEHLIALAVPALLSLFLLGPWILGRMTSALLTEQPQDGSIFVWMLRWWPYAIGHQVNPLFTTAAWAPGGINLAWVTSVPTLAVPMIPVTAVIGPVAGFNLLQLAAPVLATWTAYLLCRKIVGSFVPALVGGLCFGFSPYLMAELGQGHPNLDMVFLVPLAAYLMLRLLDGSLRARWFVLLLGLLLAVQLYLSTEVFATMTLLGAVFGVVGLLLAGRAWRQRLLRALAPTAGAYAVALALGTPLLYVAFSRPRPYKPILFSNLEHGVHGAADFLGYVVPGRFTILGSAPRWGPDGNPWYFGVPLILLLAAFLFTERRSRRAWLLAAGLVITLVLSLGDSLAVFGAHILPWRLVSSLPLLHQAQPGRLVGYAFLLVGIAVAIWLARPTERLLRWALAVLALLVIAPNALSNQWARPVPVPHLLATGAYHRYLTPGETVWIVDPVRSRQMVWQADTDFAFRLAGGFLGVTPPGLHPAAAQAQLGKGLLSGTTVADIRTFLAGHHVGAVLMYEERQGAIATITTATGVTPIRHGNLLLFLLGPHRAQPAAAGSGAAASAG